MYGQVGCFLGAVLSSSTVIGTTFWNQWVMNGAASSTMMGPTWNWKGIWAECMQVYAGQYFCEEQASMFLEDAYLNAIRGMMCIAIILTFVGCCFVLVGLQCSRLLEETPNKKRKLMITSGIMFFIGGALVLASVAWYTSMVVYEFFSFANQDNMIRYELGATTYLGYVSSLLCFVTGLMCVCMPGPKEEADKYGVASYPLRTSYPSRDEKPVKRMEYI